MLTIATIFLFIIAIFILLFFDNGIDKFNHPEEYKNSGSAGERIAYKTLIDRFDIPENQILRNLYIPTKNKQTSEIDLLVVSEKGLLVFECKNYGGHIYGDARRQQWLQYIGNKKSYFYNPLFQNRNHVKHLQAFLVKYSMDDIPIIPLIITTARGNWKISNLGHNDYILGYNCHFRELYDQLPNISTMSIKMETILSILAPFSRPDQSIKEKHIQQIKSK